MTHHPKVELLAPAGNFEKLEIAIHYGADAVYLGGKEFSLRNFSGNFSRDEIREAVKIAHHSHVKVYVTCNVYPRNSERRAIIDFLEYLGQIEPDAVIVADVGIFALARAHIPNIPIHVSTQANTTHIESALFWQTLGASRVNIARELPLAEIREIASAVDVQIESFIHGAMCIAYSGRCLLSGYLAGRDGNRGMCAQACRWRYAVIEETRPDKAMPLFEDDRGTYIFSSKDLCMIGHIGEMIEAGISSFKIEGRMKGIHYLSSVVNVYRRAIDAFYENPASHEAARESIQELSVINHRGFCTGFYFGDPDQALPEFTFMPRSEKHLFLGKVVGPSPWGVFVDVRNRLEQNTAVEILSKGRPPQKDRILEIRDEFGTISSVAQPNARVSVKLQNNSAKNDIIRKLVP
jgi:U32 family peptidase